MLPGRMRFRFVVLGPKARLQMLCPCQQQNDWLIHELVIARRTQWRSPKNVQHAPEPKAGCVVRALACCCLFR